MGRHRRDASGGCKIIDLEDTDERAVAYREKQEKNAR
jgi:hypothetical protein